MSSETLLPVMAAYVLENGLAELSLRPLAKAAGTSDRMLLYHFGSKDALIAALLDHLAQIYSVALDTAFPQGKAMSRKDCIEQVIAITRTDPFQPFMRLWWDIVAGAARGNQAYKDSAQRMSHGGARGVVDNGFATPVYQRPLELGADVVISGFSSERCAH